MANACPDGASATVVSDLPPGVIFVSSVPSQGSCIQSGLVVTCDLGLLSASGAASVVITVTSPGAPGSLESRVQVLPAGDLKSAYNVEVETTTIVDPALGDLVWEDLDGDGVQDPGEVGLQDVWVILLDPNGDAQGLTRSDPNGPYRFGGLILDASYSLLFFEPPTHVFSPQDQGADDLLDSDVDPVMGETPVFPLMDGLDPVRWDVGMVPVCIPPDEPIYVESVTLGPGNETILPLPLPTGRGSRRNCPQSMPSIASFAGFSHGKAHRPGRHGGEASTWGGPGGEGSHDRPKRRYDSLSTLRRSYCSFTSMSAVSVPVQFEPSMELVITSPEPLTVAAPSN